MSDIYRSKFSKLPGSNFKEVNRKAQEFFKEIKGKTKRKPYIRSIYFKKEKVFFDHFWIHIRQKSMAERVRRLKYFSAAIDLIKNTRNHPQSIQNPSKRSEMLHRFNGMTKNGERFYVQIKEHKQTKQKQLMSIFPPK